ncbi:hypothetical protein ACFQ1I_14025 [Kitasatospora arboriphila]
MSTPRRPQGPGDRRPHRPGEPGRKPADRARTPRPRSADQARRTPPRPDRGRGADPRAARPARRPQRPAARPQPRMIRLADPRKRLRLAGIALVVVFTVFAGRLVQLQLLDSHALASEAAPTSTCRSCCPRSAAR